MWRRAGEGETGKWHWEFSDATDTLGRNKVSNYSVNTYLCPGVAEDLFLQGLLKNKDFQTAFRQRMREYVEELTKEKAEEYLTPLLETYRVAVTATAERYGLRQTEEGYLAERTTIQEYLLRCHDGCRSFRSLYRKKRQSFSPLYCPFYGW